MPTNDTQDSGYGFAPKVEVADNTAVAQDYLYPGFGFEDPFAGLGLEDQVNSDDAFLQEFFSNDSDLETYVVSKGDTLYQIAQNYGITIDAICNQNGFQVVDSSRGLLSKDGNEFYLQQGMELKVPISDMAKEAAENQTEETKQLDSAELEQALSVEANSSDEPLRAVLKGLLGFPMKFLGSTKGSKIAVEFQVNIPTPVAVVQIILGGSFEQERKEDKKILVTHKIQPKLGVKIEGKAVEGEVTLFGFFEVTSASLDDAVSLIYYGLYKLGRSTGDSMNDWGAVFASNGGSLGMSLVMYCGLNLLYAQDEETAQALQSAENGEVDEKGFLDKLMSAESAELNVAEIEKQLFDYDETKSTAPFDGSNKNEVAYGGGIEGKVSAGDDSAGVAAEASLTFSGKNVINADTLNKTGVYGTQEAGFTDDYKIGGLKEMQLELAGGFKIGDFAIKGKHAFNWKQEQKEVTKHIGRRTIRSNEIVWIFSKYEYTIEGQFEGLTKLGDFTTRTLIEQLITKAVGKYNENKNKANEKDATANLESLETGSLIENACLELGLAEAKDVFSLTNNGGGPIKMTDSLALGLKITVEGGLKNMKPSVEVSVGRMVKMPVDLEFIQYSFTDFDVLGTFKIL